jgi:hypothetical protein
MGRRRYEDFRTTGPAVNEYCLMVPLFQNAGFVLSPGFVIPEGNSKSSINAWQKLGTLADAVHKTGRPKADFELREISRKTCERLNH